MAIFYSQFISKGDLCFDVGANIGNRTKIFLRLGAKVVASEPQQDCLKIMREAFSNNENLFLVDRALGNSEDEVDFYVADGNTISTISKDWIEAVKKSGRFSDNDWKMPQRVKTTTLDKLIEKFGTPKFIKIDVEGYESHVIEGLSTPVHFLSIEFTPEFRVNTDRCLSLLGSLGSIKLNFSIGESFIFEFSNWVSVKELAEHLDKYRNNHRLWGDIYVKFDQT